MIKDDYPGVTEFGAVPAEVSLKTIDRIESEVTGLRQLGTLTISMGEHPILGSVLVLNRNDGIGGFVLADKVAFVSSV